MTRTQRHPVRRAGALALSTALAGGTVLLAAPAANAETVDVNYHCKTPIGDKSAVSPIDIKAAAAGASYKLTMSFEKGVSSSPIELPKGVMKPSAVIRLGGAQTGTIPVDGPANDQPIPPNTPIKINDLSGTYTPRKSGRVTFTAARLTISAMGTTTLCDPVNNPKPSLTLDVKGPGGDTTGGESTGGDATGGAASGGQSTGGSASGGSATGGSATGGQTSGGAASGASGGAGTTGGSKLPQTGPGDSALALGTLGGTVLLSGVAGALWLTRRRRPTP